MYAIGEDNIVRWHITPNDTTENVSVLVKTAREYEWKNLYVRAGDYTTILYSVVRKNIHSASDFPTRREQLLYYELCGFQGVKCQLRKKTNDRGFIIADNKCAFCCNLTELYIDHCPESVFVCLSCLENIKSKRICINTRDNHESNTFTDLVNGRVDIVVADVNVGVNTLTSRGINIIMLAHKTFKNCVFDYIANKNTPWYKCIKGANCVNCGRFVKQSFSLCFHCDNYAYNVSFRSYVIMFWLINKCDIVGDVFAVIVSHVCELNLYSITPAQLIARLTAIPVKKEIVVNENGIIDDVVDCEDVITEDNMYSYLKFELNELSDEEDDDCELGYFDDEDV
jgi:hypothetical protein